MYDITKHLIFFCYTFIAATSSQSTPTTPGTACTFSFFKFLIVFKNIFHFEEGVFRAFFSYKQETYGYGVLTVECSFVVYLAACRPVRCRMYCPYGWARDAITGCERCACHDPCDVSISTPVVKFLGPKVEHQKSRSQG